ncbi:MAG: PD40 domain-containing protein, partial [Acidobacteriaceae bacterium]|nr:PD40 domain-containing protein [Acidobacteriaceae bacterium]
MRPGFVAALFLSAVSIAPPLAAKQPITEGDLLKIQRVTEVHITPDGALAVFGVQSIHSEPAEEPGDDPTYKYRVNLWTCDLRDPAAKPVQITFGNRNDSMLSISPDGRQLAFVRADSKKHPQVWIMPLRTPGEAHMLTHLERGATAPRWRPDGGALLVTSQIPLSELPGHPSWALERPARDWWDFDRPPLKESDQSATAAHQEKTNNGSPDGDLRSIRDWLEHNARHNDPADITRLNFLGELSLAEELTIRELYRVDLGTEPKATQLTRSYHDHGTAVFSPKGDRVLFAGEPESKLHPDRIKDESIVWEMNADGSNERPLVQLEGYAFEEPQFAPDGKHLVLVGHQNDQPTYRQRMLAMCDADGSHLVWLTKDGDPGVQQPEGTPDGHVYYTAGYHGGEPLRRVDLKNHQVDDVISGPVGVNAYAVSGSNIV